MVEIIVSEWAVTLVGVLICWERLCVSITCFHLLFSALPSLKSIFKLPAMLISLLSKSDFSICKEKVSIHSDFDDGGLYTEQNKKDFEFFNLNSNQTDSISDVSRSVLRV